MAEFGENIRKKREELGITQQTLADSLYVTRQAVSKWENGSRYPDLLTAKKLSEELGTSLDELLADDNMRTYAKVNPIIEYPFYKRIQTALFAAAFSTNLILLIWYIAFRLINYPSFMNKWESAAQLVGLIVSGVITAILFFGVIKSVRDAITPRTAALISTTIVGVDFINQFMVVILNAQNNTLNENSIISFIIFGIIDIVFIILTLLYFLSNKTRSPIPIYIISGFVIFMFSISYVLMLIGDIGTAQLPEFIMTSALRFFAVLLIPTLFIYMATVLYRKRRLAKN